MTIERVGVVGCGLMGAGIAQVCATAGYTTVVREIAAEPLERGMEGIRGRLQRSVAKGRLDGDQATAILSRLTPTTDLADLGRCDLVIEAVTERREVKLETFAALDEACRPEAIFASNTSSLTITEMAVATRRPDRFIGLHFFNPVPAMKLVEVVSTLLSDESVLAQATEFVRSLDKTAVRARDRTGFIVNRLLVPYLLEAIRALDSGLATAEDIDSAMRLGAGYPMGPFTLLDFVGLDTTYYIANIMYEEFKEPQFAPPPLLKRMVLAGRLGRKSGRGFYDYEQEAQG